jgi:hypothetical protein
MKSLQRSRRGLGFVEGAGARDSTLAFEESAIGRGHREKILCSSAIDILQSIIIFNVRLTFLRDIRWVLKKL